jgi:hypothetical protein
MNRIATRLLITCTVVSLLAGCRPEKRMTWSPNGQWLAVRAGDGLRLSDADGILSPPAEGNYGSLMWLPDSSGLIAVKAIEAHTWDELAPLLGDAEAKRMIEWSERTKQEVLAYKGNLDDLKLRAERELSPGELAAVLLHLRDTASDALRKRLGDHMDDLQQATANAHLIERLTITKGTPRTEQVLRRSAAGPGIVDISPDGRVIAFATAMAGQEAGRLYVMPTDGDAPARTVASATSVDAAFTPDGRSLVYAQARTTPMPNSGEFMLGIIVKTEVVTADGKLRDTFDESTELAGVIFHAETPITCLSDGRIVFAAFELTLPSAADDLPPHVSLFHVDPARSPVVSRLITRQVEGEVGSGLIYFDISPDEKRVLVPQEDGAIAIVTLATGQSWTVVGANHDNSLRVLPAWRSANEISIVKPIPRPGSGDANADGDTGTLPNEVVLLTLDCEKQEATERVLSAAWPAPARADLLDAHEEKTGGD